MLMHAIANLMPMENIKTSKRLLIVLEIEIDMGTIMILDTGKVVDGVVSGDLLDIGFGLIPNGMYGEAKNTKE